MAVTRKGEPGDYRTSLQLRYLMSFSVQNMLDQSQGNQAGIAPELTKTAAHANVCFCMWAAWGEGAKGRVKGNVIWVIIDADAF